MWGKARRIGRLLSAAGRRLAAPPSVYLGDHRALTRTIYGHAMLVDTRDLSLGPTLLLHGDWEGEVTLFLLGRLRPGMNVIDVGANIGWYSVLMASRVGSAGTLMAFEANPSAYELCHHNLVINGLIARSEVYNI